MHGALAAQAVKSKRNKKEEHERRRLFRKVSQKDNTSVQSPVPTTFPMTFLNVGIVFTIIGGILLGSAYLIPNNALDDLQSIGIICLVIGLALLVLNIFFGVIWYLYQRARREVERSPGLGQLEEEDEESGGRGDDDEADEDKEDPGKATINLINLEKIAQEVDCTQRL